MITILLVPGTNEHNNVLDLREGGMLANVWKELDSTQFDARVVLYPADYGLRTAYALSVAAGELAVEAAIREAGEVFDGLILLGYSQGAAVVGNVANRLRHIENGGKVLAVGLVSDPARHRAQFRPLIHAPEGFGCTGERFINEQQLTRDGDPVLVWQLAAQGDPICCLPEGNALRSIADLTDFMSLRDPRKWLDNMIEDFKSRRMQRWWSWRNWRTWTGVLAFSRGMLFDGRHFCYPKENPPGFDRTFTRILADEITRNFGR